MKDETNIIPEIKLNFDKIDRNNDIDEKQINININ